MTGQAARGPIASPIASNEPTPRSVAIDPSPHHSRISSLNGARARAGPLVAAVTSTRTRAQTFTHSSGTWARQPRGWDRLFSAARVRVVLLVGLVSCRPPTVSCLRDVIGSSPRPARRSKTSKLLLIERTKAYRPGTGQHGPNRSRSPRTSPPRLITSPIAPRATPHHCDREPERTRSRAGLHWASLRSLDRTRRNLHALEREHGRPPTSVVPVLVRRRARVRGGCGRVGSG